LAAYAYTMLCLGDICREIRRLHERAVPHPHGREARVIVFKDQLEQLLAAAAKVGLGDHLTAAQRLGDEVHQLRRLGLQAASTRAVVLRVHEFLRTLPPGTAGVDELTHALEVELGGRRLPAEVTPRVLADCYFPVDKGSPPKDGDVIFDTETEQVVEGGAGELGDAQVRMRPVGYQAGVWLRLRAVAVQLAALSDVEASLAKRFSKGPHHGRAQGLKMAHELLVGPSWALLPATFKDDAVVAQDQAQGVVSPHEQAT
jgi:hypothetical protein